jgi:hypothetical protein
MYVDLNRLIAYGMCAVLIFAPPVLLIWGLLQTYVW